jgi:hypothetical protein
MSAGWARVTRSRERAAALKQHGHCCARCGVHASVAEVRVVKRTITDEVVL